MRRGTGVAERATPQQQREVSDFLDAVLASAPMQYVHACLTAKVRPQVVCPQVGAAVALLSSQVSGAGLRCLPVGGECAFPDRTNPCFLEGIVQDPMPALLQKQCNARLAEQCASTQGLA